MSVTAGVAGGDALPVATRYPTSNLRLTLRRLARSPGAVLGALIVLIFLIISVGAPWLAPHNIDQANFAQTRQPPSATR